MEEIYFDGSDEDFGMEEVEAMEESDMDGLIDNNVQNDVCEREGTGDFDEYSGESEEEGYDNTQSDNEIEYDGVSDGVNTEGQMTQDESDYSDDEQSDEDEVDGSGNIGRANNDTRLNNIYILLRLGTVQLQ